MEVILLNAHIIILNMFGNYSHMCLFIQLYKPSCFIVLKFYVHLSLNLPIFCHVDMDSYCIRWNIGPISCLRGLVLQPTSLKTQSIQHLHLGIMKHMFTRLTGQKVVWVSIWHIFYMSIFLHNTLYLYIRKSGSAFRCPFRLFYSRYNDRDFFSVCLDRLQILRCLWLCHEVCVNVCTV